MLTWLVLAGVAGIVVYRFRTDVIIGYRYSRRAVAPIKTSLLPVPEPFRRALDKYFPYYQQLSPSEKVRFERRVTSFIYRKRFVPRNIDAVTVEAKVLIAATAVQLTFGLPEIYLRHFHTILVYPTDYYSTITKQYHRGEVNPMFGIIVLSWQSFVDGFISPDSGLNLGLHEMAHALRLENIIRNEEYQFFDSELLDTLDSIAHRVCTAADPTYQLFLREYACTNVHEFFAVAVENFFERPRPLQETMPELYTILQKLLNQDPSAVAT